MGWVLLILVLVVAAAALALQYSIGRNGPKVLDTVDRLIGGDRNVTLVHTESLGEHAKQKLTVYRAEDDSAAAADSKPVLLFVHGGGWRSGDIDDYGFFARGFAPEGYVVVLVGYRLGPDGMFPNMLEDTAKGIAWTRNNIAQYGGDPDAIFISGHSAGAYNVAMLGLDRQWIGREGLDTDDIAGVIGISGPYDFYPFDSESTKLAFGGAEDPQATQPVNFARTDAPPLLLIQGGKDTVVSPCHAPALEGVVTQAGGEAKTAMFSDMGHNTPILAMASPWRRDRTLIETINAFTANVVRARQAKAPDDTSVPVQAETG
ncbi:alpha/beta hydrolase [Pontixanthobacter aestiaquae]|uniref:Alpha/beta hydrolase fold domain-containing protein n=1 Tax=Pontixanthobacter aestiaquae TaxID=1509367 RepID=A0A844Z520_9SPHN|nr:alpha/beta hydrolase [Pontixanthobacter aestiaquae]MDN3646821.1 alpha/beta hydrolase [Pontixanthobacter aestiaquae]MXO82197.1 alpha/beta hydrolase fold domain-containing protein [Pontixanthobacter aestiaquae]